MSEFTITRLVNSRAIVAGTDEFGVTGQTVIDTTQWDEIVAQDDHMQAHDEFDARVLEFFAPLTEAAELLNAEPGTVDDVATIVLQEGSEGVAPTERIEIRLDRGSVILRLVENNETDRLVWVDGDLEILAAPKQATFKDDPIAFDMKDEAAIIGEDPVNSED